MAEVVRAITATLITAAILVLASCSEGGSSATCTPSGTELRIAVLESQSHEFTTDCLAAPAGKPFTIEFDNQDTSGHGNHNIRIFDGGALFVGDVAMHGTSITYEVGAIEAGTYEFQCDEHAAGMNGAFIVE